MAGGVSRGGIGSSDTRPSAWENWPSSATRLRGEYLMDNDLHDAGDDCRKGPPLFIYLEPATFHTKIELPTTTVGFFAYSQR